MAECVNYEQHEVHCDHPGERPPNFNVKSKRRWKTRDGCQGTVCPACFYGFVVAWPDLVEIDVVDENGISIDRDKWSVADHYIMEALEKS